ncbi:hypothetical protein ABZY57_10015 [Streptomyces sp. NPDC006450]|uniref:hypothetical protein n=1 Tax=Streptomyces sp. NPDC006450 TaxID=3155458 RepID=UPI0033A912CF
MRWRRSAAEEQPRYCRVHQVPQSARPNGRGMERNRRGVCGVEGCRIRIDKRGRVRQISGAKVDDVLRAHREVAHQPERGHGGAWLSGSFYLVAFVATAAVTVGASLVAAPWTVPLVIVGSLLGVGTIGAFQLRHDDKLSEQRFVELIKMTFLNIPAVLRRSPPPVDPLPGAQTPPGL